MTRKTETLKEFEEMEFTTTLGTAVFMTNEPARDVRRKQSAQARRLRVLSREVYANDLLNQTNANGHDAGPRAATTERSCF